MDTNEILEDLKRKLQVPQPGAAGTTPIRAGAGHEEWYRLRRAIRDLEESAAKVGEIPSGYPMHVNVVMRAVHSLLPWYTRPLREHALQTAAVARALEAVLEYMQAEQDGASKGAGREQPE